MAYLRGVHAKIAGIEMEAAGAWSAAFNQADPARIMMVRGISDRGKASKNKLDKEKKWRIAAAFNAAKFVEQFIRFGNVEALNCNQIELDLTPQIEINSNFRRARGYSYPSFPRIMTTLGPLLEVSLMASARDGKGSVLRILRATWTEFSSLGKKTSEMVLTPNQSVLRFDLERKTFHRASLDLEIEGRLAELDFEAIFPTRKYGAKYFASQRRNNG